MSICSLISRLRSIFMIVLLAAAAEYAAANPACPDVVDAAQPDGAKFKIRLRGDEFFSWHETSDGYAIQKDSADGFWKYARPAAGKAAFEIVPGAKVGSADPVKLQLGKRALPERKALLKEIKARRMEIMGGAGATKSSASSPDSQPPARMPLSADGTVKNIVILACFSDHWDSTNNTVLSTQGHVNPAEYADVFNQPGYSADGAKGSVRDYYRAVSYGKLTVNSVVAGWVKLPQNEVYYGADGTSKDTNWRQMLTDAISLADAYGFDFSQGDGDGDGWVDCVTIIHSGHGQENSVNPDTCVWSKAGDLSSVVTVDGVRIKHSHTEAALRGGMTNLGIMRIGAPCHEMGHSFGSPDLYDPSYATQGLGDWCLMAGGSWNGSEASPAHMSAYAKSLLGFVNPVRIHTRKSIPLPRVEDNPVVHMITDGMSTKEYFLVENRAKYGFDNTSVIYPGILIYHVYPESGNNNTDTWDHPLVKIEEADGDDSLGMGWESSGPGDVWTISNGLTGGFCDQTGNMDTNAMLYQSGISYSRLDLAASYTYNRLSDFSTTGTTMTYSALTVRTAVADAITANHNFKVTWNACASATKYELQESTPITATSFFDSAEDQTAMEENWIITGPVKRDTAYTRSGTYAYGFYRDLTGVRHYADQILTLARPFKVTASTVISYYYHLDLDTGYFMCQISNDNGATWKSLARYSGFSTNGGPAIYAAHDFAALNAAGINANDSCIIRFVADFEAFGTLIFLTNGYTLDDVRISNIEMPSYMGWKTVSNNISGTNYQLGRGMGLHAFRVQALVNDVWRGFGPAGVTDVRADRCTVLFKTDGTVGASLTGETSQSLTFGSSGTSVLAKAPTGWRFVNWTKSGSAFSTANPLMVTNVTSDMTLVANFARNQYQLNYLASLHGKITGTTLQKVDFGFDGLPVMALADKGYHFTKWSDGSTMNPRMDKNVSSALRVIAYFALGSAADDWTRYE